VVADVAALVASHRALTHVSFVGFSLGGLYACYAVAAFWDASSGRMEGLLPQTFVAVACPMLDVLCFGLMRFLPGVLWAGATVLFGTTAAELMLQDAAPWGLPTLLAMTTDGPRRGEGCAGGGGGDGGGHISGVGGGGGGGCSALGEGGVGSDTDLPFPSALRSFHRRSLLANVSKDAIVAFGSDTLETTQCRLFPLGSYALPPSAIFILTYKDAYGGRPWFSFAYPPGVAGGAGGVGGGAPPPRPPPRSPPRYRR